MLVSSKGLNQQVQRGLCVQVQIKEITRARCLPARLRQRICWFARLMERDPAQALFQTREPEMRGSAKGPLVVLREEMAGHVVRGFMHFSASTQQNKDWGDTTRY